MSATRRDCEKGAPKNPKSSAPFKSVYDNPLEGQSMAEDITATSGGNPRWLEGVVPYTP
jgi:hypothetical protein